GGGGAASRGQGARPAGRRLGARTRMGPESLDRTVVSRRPRLRRRDLRSARFGPPCGRARDLGQLEGARSRANREGDVRSPGGRIVRRPDGTPSGVLVDNAANLVERVLPEATPADRERRLLAAARACAAAGLTKVE